MQVSNGGSGVTHHWLLVRQMVIQDAWSGANDPRLLVRASTTSQNHSSAPGYITGTNLVMTGKATPKYNEFYCIISPFHRFNFIIILF